MTDVYDDLIAKSYNVPPGRERIAVLEELINLADANQEAEISYGARRDLIEEANHSGFPDKAIVAFSWCLNQFDKNPQLDDWFSIIWQYKVIQEWIPVFASVTREQITKMQEDMAKRLLANGESERTAHYYRSWNFMRMGDYDTALEYQTTYMKMKRGQMSDCEACELDRQVELLSRMKLDKKAIKLAKPIIKGRSHCGEVPHFTNAHICKSLIRLDRVDEARKMLSDAYQIVNDERKYLGTIGDLLLVPLRTRQLDAAFNCAKRHFIWAAETSADELRFRFFCSCSLLWELLANEKKTIKLRLPNEWSCFNESGDYKTVELAKWFANETRKLADLFNKRNGNDRYDEIIADNRALAGL